MVLQLEFLFAPRRYSVVCRSFLERARLSTVVAIDHSNLVQRLKTLNLISMMSRDLSKTHPTLIGHVSGHFIDSIMRNVL
jgi:hypothetical protein